MVFYTSGRVTCSKINLTDGLFACETKLAIPLLPLFISNS